MTRVRRIFHILGPFSGRPFLSGCVVGLILGSLEGAIVFGLVVR